VDDWKEIGKGGVVELRKLVGMELGIVQNGRREGPRLRENGDSCVRI